MPQAHKIDIEMKLAKKRFDLIGGRTGLFVVYAIGIAVLLLQLRSIAF